MLDISEPSARRGSRRAAALLALATLAAGPPANAATIDGHGALALAAIVGQYDPALPAAAKAGLLRLLADRSFGSPHYKTLTIKADAVCRAGDVDLKAFSCSLTFGAHTRSLEGRQAAELFAILAAAGVPGDGAAGTIFEGVKPLSCTLNLRQLGGPGMGDGGGAACTYAVP